MNHPFLTDCLLVVTHTVADAHWGSISGTAPVAKGSPVQWMGSDELDDPNLACGQVTSHLAQFAVASSDGWVR